MAISRCPGCMREKHRPVCEHCGFDEKTQNLPHQLRIGTILRGQYQIGRVLGQGGFGITYLGWDMYLNMPVAVKEYFPNGCVTRDSSVSSAVTSFSEFDPAIYAKNKERFMNEGRALARFSKLQNIVRIYSFFPENNTVYLVMEYAQGMTLKDKLHRQGLMRMDQLLPILGPIMEDLEQVHRAGTIHRDISPDNIMLMDNGNVKLLDFGAVRDVENPDQEAQLSKSTEAILKQGFAPLEQYNARGSLGPWTDVYALCATICYCLNGRVPPYAPDRAMSDRPDAFIDALPLQPPLKEVLRRGMALRPKDRTASVGELLRQLHDPMSLPRSGAPVRKPEPVPAPQPRKSHRGLIAGSLAALFLVGGLLVGTVLKSVRKPQAPALEEVHISQALPPEYPRLDQVLEQAHGGDTDARFELGRRFEQGIGVPSDQAEALQWYQQAADQGDLMAINNLGRMYLLGQGTEPDPEKAIALFRQAAEGLDPMAMVNLGICCEYGLGLEADPAEAARWYQKAADQGDANGQYSLGICYLEGTGVNADREEAERLLNLAAQAGHSQARQRLSDLEN